VRQEAVIADKSIYHKNLMPVVYVTADVAGAIESPVYAILKLSPQIEDRARLTSEHQWPTDDNHYAMKWDGEWHITYEVFRDLGLAFAAVLILIYGLVVGWFQSFLTPLIIMAAIPFSLVGILPGARAAARLLHGDLDDRLHCRGRHRGAELHHPGGLYRVAFEAEGMPLDAAVIDAGAVRFRPMMLTAAAVVVGSAVILFDPIFQGLAIALMAGEIASLALSRMTVPIVYFVVNRRRSA
jgi:multidrug efflux pump subunit AcrB